MLTNFSKAGAETANSKLEILCWRLDAADAGRSAAVEGSSAFQSKSDTTAPARRAWTGRAVALQAASKECRGHPKETTLSGDEVTWLLLKLDLK